ncbi:glycosyltransferase [Enterococcus faecium]|uniref:glycosyltransferase n=1 Tax=Enterococcus faecium TaxID=1352 RepID=UPI0023AA1AA1|nr:glycosyltransferase [Enterococcus faecium]
MPFYKGEKFLNRINKNITNLKCNAREEKISVEFIIINDSPSIKLPTLTENIIEINNIKNEGIHYSRIRGLKEAKGEYVIFLDQDDEIDSKNVIKHYKFIKQKNADVSVSNGMFIFGEKNKPIYLNKFYKRNVCKEFSYLYIRDLIISPGQCIIKKNSIPSEWLQHIMVTNGTDDYLLWLLMLNDKNKFVYFDEFTYCHYDTGNNVSFDIDNWRKSLNELEHILYSIPEYPNNKVKRLRKLNSYKYSLLKETKFVFLLKSIFNIDLFAANIIFSLINGSAVVGRKEMKKGKKFNE